MFDATYRLLIGDLCREVGIEDTEAVFASNHIQVDGTAVGLIPYPEQEDRLSIFVELGPVHRDNEQHVREVMLVANMEQRGELTGSFGLHPVNGNAAYHLSVALPITGVELAARVGAVAREAAARFAAIQII